MKDLKPSRAHLRVRNFLAFLLFSAGVPTILANAPKEDEIG